jgi:hypothetical protein
LALALPSVIKSFKLKKHGVSTESTVLTSKRRSSSKGPTTYEVTVTFNTPDGSEATATALKRSSIPEGDKVMIWYNPADPKKIDFGDSIGYNMRGVVIGGLIILFGFYLLFRLIISDSANNMLKRSGMKIAAEFVSVERNERYRMGDKNPWIIKCRWTDNMNNKEYHFVSKDYVEDPTQHLTGRGHIDVFINPADPSKYYMDTSFIPGGNITMG